MAGNWLEGTSRNEERKGATKIKPKKRNKNNISKGCDEKNNVEMDDRRQKQEKMTNREWF